MLLGLVSTATPALAGPTACDNRTNNTYAKLLECMTARRRHEHLSEFQKIADNNDDEFYPGTRAAGTEGYADSVEYVAGLLSAPATRSRWTSSSSSSSSRPCSSSSPRSAATYETGAFTGSGFGEVTGNVIPVDINLDPPRATTSGCEAADFAAPGLQRAQRHRPDPARRPPAPPRSARSR